MAFMMLYKTGDNSSLADIARSWERCRDVCNMYLYKVYNLFWLSDYYFITKICGYTPDLTFIKTQIAPKNG